MVNSNTNDETIKESFHSPKHSNFNLNKDKEICSPSSNTNIILYPSQPNQMIDSNISTFTLRRDKIIFYLKYFFHCILGVIGLIGFIIATGGLRITQKKLISRGVLDAQCLYEKGDSISFSNVNPYSALGFSLSFYLILFIYEISLGVELYCKKSHIYSLGGKLFFHLILCIAGFIIGIFIFYDQLLDVCSCISKNSYCNAFRLNGILCMITSFFYLCNISFDLYFYHGIQQLFVFLRPNSQFSDLSSTNYHSNRRYKDENIMTPETKYNNKNIRLSVKHSSSKNLYDTNLNINPNITTTKSPKSPRTDYLNV